MSVVSNASASRPSTGAVDAAGHAGSLTRGALKVHNQATEDKLDSLLERSQVLSSLLQKVERAMAEEEAPPAYATALSSRGGSASQPAAAARGPAAPRGVHTMAAPSPAEAPAAAPKVTIPLSDMEQFHANEKMRQEYERARMLKEIAEAVRSSPCPLNRTHLQLLREPAARSWTYPLAAPDAHTLSRLQPS